jgi:hypothetical protein
VRVDVQLRAFAEGAIKWPRRAAWHRLSPPLEALDEHRLADRHTDSAQLLGEQAANGVVQACGELL